MAAAGINPFRYSGPVPVGDLVDREGERHAIIDLAWSANNSRLAAPRRYGKTSLLRAVLARAADEGWASVYVDFFGVLTLTDIAQRIEAAYSEQLVGRMGQWFAAVRRTLNPVARLGGGPLPASLELSGSGSADDPLVERLNLPRRLYQKDGKRVLIAFDEFQDVLGAGNADAVIRAQIQHHGDAASYIFAGSHVGMMEELFADKRRAFYAQAKQVALPPLEPPELAEFITERFTRTGKEIGHVLGSLLDAAAGHPQRSMLLAHTLWDTTPMGETADEARWVQAYTQVLADTVDEAKSTWMRLSATERRVLTSVAENLGGLYSKASGNPRGGSTTGALESLVAAGEVAREPTSRTGYRVIDPLLAEWLRAGRPSQ